MGVTLLTELPEGVTNKPYHDEMYYFQLVKAVEDSKGSLTQAAWACGFHNVTLREWVAQGDNDILMEVDSPLAHLSIGIRKAQHEVVKKLVEGSLSKKYNAKFVQWWLGVVFRQQFGLDSGMLEYLLEKATKLEQSIGKLNLKMGYNKSQSDLNTGSIGYDGHQKEMDSQGD